MIVISKGRRVPDAEPVSSISKGAHGYVVVVVVVVMEYILYVYIQNILLTLLRCFRHSTIILTQSTRNGNVVVYREKQAYMFQVSSVMGIIRQGSPSHPWDGDNLWLTLIGQTLPSPKSYLNTMSSPQITHIPSLGSYELYPKRFDDSSP